MQGVRLLQGSELLAAEPSGSRLRFRLRRDDPAEPIEVDAEALLVTGPFPNRFDGLNLAALDLSSPPPSGLPVDRSLHVCAGRIWAMGEAVQPGLSAEAAALQAQRLLTHGGHPHSRLHPGATPLSTPHVIGTDPALVIVAADGDRPHPSARRLVTPITPSAARGVPGFLELRLDPRGRIRAAAASDRDAARLLTLLRQACDQRWTVARMAAHSTLDARLDDALASLASTVRQQRDPRRGLARLIRSLAGYLPAEPPATPAPGPTATSAQAASRPTQGILDPHPSE